MRELLDTRALRLDASDSDPEVVLAEALQAFGAPPPVYHYLVKVGHETFEVDFAYPEAMLLVEVDGFGPHTTPEAFEEDRRRQNLLVDKGYMVRRYTRNRVDPPRGHGRGGDRLLAPGCGPLPPREPRDATGQLWPVTLLRTPGGAGYLATWAREGGRAVVPR